MNSYKPDKIIQSVTNNEGLLTLISLAALTITFVVSNLEISFAAKLAIFISTVFLYLSFYLGVYFRRKRRDFAAPEIPQPETVFNEEVEAKLFALEEAHQFFGASLKFDDMFRLIASRLNDIVPFTTCVLFTADEEKSILKFQFAAGENMREFVGLKIPNNSALAGTVLQSGKIEIKNHLSEDRKIISAKALKNLQSGIGVPLFKGAAIFGVLVLYGDGKHQFNRNSAELLEAAAARIAPLFISSQTLENSLTNSLTDALTTLPNERAFYLVLENQIAEAQRFRGDRPLTVLTIDVKNFNEVNQKFGHSTGDLLLAFAAEKIKAQLRQMDFLARMNGDEFFAVLPTASERITLEIIERIRKIFVLNPFKTASTESVHLQLNFGASSFGRDGETADNLVKYALLKKQQSKHAAGESKILFFPKEFVN